MDGAPRFWHWDEGIDDLRGVLANAGVVAIPTESSYGLAVDPRDPRGVETIYAVKGREAEKALPVVVTDIGQLVELGVSPDTPELAVARLLWPAALTILFSVGAPLPATAGLSTLAARVPTHVRLCELLYRLGHGLTATSANRSGQPPILDPEDLVPLLWGHDVVVIDDGTLPGGPPSTLVHWPEGELDVLRPGAFPVQDLPRRLGAID